MDRKRKTELGRTLELSYFGVSGIFPDEYSSYEVLRSELSLIIYPKSFYKYNFNSDNFVLIFLITIFIPILNHIKLFSKACEYGIRASTYIALKSIEGKRVSLKEIAEKIDSPVAFTAKILQQLVKTNIVNSVKGATGGFEMQRSRMDVIMLSEIVYALDGNKVYAGCALGLKDCNASKPCPVHDKFVEIRTNLKHMLESTSLYEMTAGLEVGLTHLKC